MPGYEYSTGFCDSLCFRDCLAPRPPSRNPLVLGPCFLIHPALEAGDDPLHLGDGIAFPGEGVRYVPASQKPLDAYPVTEALTP